MKHYHIIVLMHDIEQFVKNFNINQPFSEEELQISYKKLVKKYHPDFNQKEESLANEHMSLINNHYEACKIALKSFSPSSTFSEASPKPRASHISFNKVIKDFSIDFNHSIDLFFEYGLENRSLRTEGVRRFRYRSVTRALKTNIKKTFEIDEFSFQPHEQEILRAYKRFIGNFYRYILLEEQDFYESTEIRSIWYKIDQYLLESIKIVLSPFILPKHICYDYGRSYKLCQNYIVYLEEKFPKINQNKWFLIVFHLSDSLHQLLKLQDKFNIIIF